MSVPFGTPCIKYMHIYETYSETSLLFGACVICIGCAVKIFLSGLLHGSSAELRGVYQGVREPEVPEPNTSVRFFL